MNYTLYIINTTKQQKMNYHPMLNFDTLALLYSCKKTKQLYPLLLIDLVIQTPIYWISWS